MIFIRADANEKIASGHIMRCSAIAQAFIDKGKNVTFITADEVGQKMAEGLGYECIALGTQWDRMNGEIEKLQKILAQGDAEFFLVDSYFVPEGYFDFFNEIVKTAYIDDFLDKSLNCDVVINYGISVNKENYRHLYPHSKMLFGGDYTPLRKDFQNCSPKLIKKDVSEMLVLTGGSDNDHVILNICRALLKRSDRFGGCSINIVCGRFNRDYDIIFAETSGTDYIRIYKNLDNIKSYMDKADVCVTAGGTTTKELASCGTPSITYSIADNQIGGVKELDELGLMKYIGDVRTVDFTYDNLIDELIELCSDLERRKRESVLLQKVIDGKGALRLVEELLK